MSSAQLRSILLSEKFLYRVSTSVGLTGFALGLVLFLVTLVLNLIALRVVRRYREAYE